MVFGLFAEGIAVIEKEGQGKPSETPAVKIEIEKAGAQLISDHQNCYLALNSRTLFAGRVYSLQSTAF